MQASGWAREMQVREQWVGKGDAGEGGSRWTSLPVVVREMLVREDPGGQAFL